jgi:DNA polymerase-3 subunit delta
LDVLEFLKNVENEAPAPVYLFCPHRAPNAREATFEPLLAQRAVERLVDLYVDPNTRDLAYSVYYADEADPREIVSVSQTLPFLSERQVVVIHGAERYESESAAGALMSYLENPAETTVLILIANSIDRRLKLYKTCTKHATIVECPELRERDALAWARQEIDRRGKRIDGPALQALIDRTGTRLGDVSNAVNLLINYIGAAESITAQDVATACADVAEEEIWSLTDAIASSDTDKAVRVLREILDLGKNEFEILGSINWLLKTAYFAAPPSSNRLKPFLANKVRPLAAKLGKEKFRDAFSLCMDTEILLRSTGVDRTLALELLVVKLAAPRRAARA